MLTAESATHSADLSWLTLDAVALDEGLAELTRRLARLARGNPALAEAVRSLAQARRCLRAGLLVVDAVASEGVPQ